MSALTAGKYWRMRRLADAKGRFKMMAIDQRKVLVDPLAERLRIASPTHAQVTLFKRLVVETLAPHVSAVLLDPYYAYPGAIDVLPASSGLLTTIEEAPAEKREDGSLWTHLNPAWPVAKGMRAGSDAIKLLVFFRPDAPVGVVLHQQDVVRRIGDECRLHDVVHVLELLDYALPQDGNIATESDTRYTERIIESVRTFAAPEYGVDIFKLPAPVRRAPAPDDDAAITATERAFARMAEACGRPWVLLSAGVADAEFFSLLAYAYRAGASGYLAGRALWQRAIARYPDREGMVDILNSEGLAYLKRVNDLTDELAWPWHEHPCWMGGPELRECGERFMTAYPDARF